MFHSTEFRRLQEERGNRRIGESFPGRKQSQALNYNKDLLLEVAGGEKGRFFRLRGTASPNESNEGREEMEKECPFSGTRSGWSTERNAKWQEQNCRQAKRQHPCLINRKSLCGI